MPDPLHVSSQSQYASYRFNLVEETFRHQDAVHVRPIIHHPGAVAVLAQPDESSVLLVRQFRYPVRRWTLEIPAGTREEGEDPLLTAQRELSEEAGMAAHQWQELLKFYPAIGVSDEEMILYRAADLHPAPGQPDAGELVQAEVVALADCRDLLRQGLICDAKTLIALGLLLGGQWWLSLDEAPC